MSYPNLPIAVWYHRWLRGNETRAAVRAMNHLSDHMLRDIGISRADIEAAVRGRAAGE